MDHVKNIINVLRKDNETINEIIGKWEEVLNKSRKLTEQERKIIMEKDIGKKPNPIRKMGMLKPDEREWNKKSLEKYEKEKKEWEEKNADLI